MDADPVFGDFGSGGNNGDDGAVADQYQINTCEQDFVEFVLNKRDEHGTATFKESLVRNVDRGHFILEVPLLAINHHNPRLYSEIYNKPLLYLEACERGCKKAFYAAKYGYPVEEVMRADLLRTLMNQDGREEVPDIQLQLTGTSPVSLRELQAEAPAEKICTLTGIVISATKAQQKAHRIKLVCRNCQDVEVLKLGSHRDGKPIPRKCKNRNPGDEPCPLDPYQILPDDCSYMDIQRLKVQELPEQVPSGDMPRHVSVHVTRDLVDKVVPGARLNLVGIFSTVDKHMSRAEARDEVVTASVREAYIHLLGMSDAIDQPGRQIALTDEDRENIRREAAAGGVREKLYKSIAPSIFGSEDIKRALACLLFSGSRKLLPDKTRIRGDINVLLLGDPGTAKSQFLKFVERAAPVAVYTSGKGSSAAGLTAAIVRDASGAFALEGGAMVLADGGVVCIDEFDKMRADDRVAIHEGMEQQTISIAKAGITTVLSTRCSVLAAANPSFGSYDETKETADQLDFQTTILSRFDTIFLVRDETDVVRDATIARHVVGLHTAGADVHVQGGVAGFGAPSQQMIGAEPEEDAAPEGGFSVAFLRKYISYARANVHPRLNDEARETLANTYTDLRKTVQEERAKGSQSSIPITVRQLEAIIRISESLAKMELSDQVGMEHVEEAVRLFNRSTMEAARSGLQMDEQLSPEEQAEVEAACDALKRRLHVGGRMARNAVVKTLLGKDGFQQKHAQRAVQILLRTQEIEETGNFMLFRRK
uniref:DNA replication licensing factor MCM5 n=1 Tax=Chromera velia CCMP2878 TaxID=1169474 RepID=A0A0G4HFX9_9ALVE|mmetsp:Transcript_47963/g.94650  ORF Transcript_47963/g.94650 Transcript_47963/m.94650 type:complete len:765 (+) Transcript_47963:260-2554(+)|eukprot:Cvel_6718.t1-p1 / transcript=Cvel_6718.t1 / gene=Cvel_6718 / organism=Chromera_velia_CCMP2878 / gene_product=DNA replication licensing factor MCM5, putative / transcript_product=DNA replication licensing factor MCM5, putative / location=Cvel_scaffold335:78502-83188(+) / protein_length=764 / sequence_SO=supercontig / SO=protein_coding / is_pseudo=false